MERWEVGCAAGVIRPLPPIMFALVGRVRESRNVCWSGCLLGNGHPSTVLILAIGEIGGLGLGAQAHQARARTVTIAGANADADADGDRRLHRPGMADD